jgi:hypothetical protein
MAVGLVISFYSLADGCQLNMKLCGVSYSGNGKSQINISDSVLNMFELPSLTVLKVNKFMTA